MAIELSGQLSEDVLGNLLQYLSLNLATGCLQVRRTPTQTSEVYFEQGKVVHVLTGTRTAIPALAALMSWNSGSFQFKSGMATPTKTINLPLDSLLLEAAYNADMAALSSEYTPENTLIEGSILVVLTIPANAKFTLSVRAIQLLRNIDGKSKLIEVAERMSLSFNEICSAANELLGQKLSDVALSPMVNPDFIAEMGQVVIAILGPLGEVVVEDAIYDLGLEPHAIPESSLNELITEVKAQFKRDDWKREFENQIRRSMEKYRLR
jgi:hypothetical protein